MDTTSYRSLYDSLDLGDNEFRLLLINGIAEIGQPLVCGFLKCKVPNNVTKYVAISYTWGSQPSDHILYCNGLPVNVTKSCFDALSVCARHGKSAVWIDQLCVDQLNLEERSKQVLLMSQIYSGAKVVLAWLDKFDKLSCGIGGGLNENLSIGDEAHVTTSDVSNDTIADPKSDTNLDQEFADVESIVTQIHGYQQKCWSGQDRITSAQLVLEAQKLKLPTSLKAWDRVLAILGHPYWQRRWIAQEFAHPDVPAAIMLDYRRSIHWKVAYSCGWVMVSVCLYRLPEIEQILPPVVFAKVKSLYQPLASLINMLSLKNKFTNSVNAKILSLLVQCRRLKTTVQLDRVYAVQSLALDEGLPKPDYSLPLAEMLLRLGQHLINHGHGGEVIAQAGFAYRHDNIVLPTWCPTYDAMHWSPLNDTKIPVGFAAAGSSLAKMSLSDNGNTLQVQGACVGHVQSLSESIDVALKNPKYLQIIKSFLALLPVAEPSSAVLETISTLIRDDKVIYEESRSEADRIELILQIIQYSDNLITRTDLHKDIKIRLDVVLLKTLSFERIFHGRKMCLATTGHIGIINNSTKIGDLVTVLDGVNVTMVLRPDDKNDETYLVIGDSYFVGLGKGEAMEPECKLERREFSLS